MFRRLARGLAVAGAALALAVTGAGIAVAQDANTARLEISPNVANQGDNVRATPTCTGTGQRVESLSSPAVEAFNNDHRGRVRTDIAAGDYTVTLTCSFDDGSDEGSARDTETATATLRVRRDGDRFDSCDDYNRNGIRDIRRGDGRYRDNLDRDRNGVACDRGDVIVSDDGKCVTFRADRDRFGGTLNDRIRRYNDLVNDARESGSVGGTSITTEELDRINEALADVNARRGDFDRVSGELKTICKDDSPAPVTVINQVEAPEGAKASSSGGQVSQVPSGGAETGDGSTEADDAEELIVATASAGLALAVVVSPTLALLAEDNDQ